MYTAITIHKAMIRCEKQLNNYDPRRRKQYRKARFRKAAARFERFCEAEEARYAD